jgi:hypothetical protein
MAYQEIDLGTSAGDGTGDTIRVGGDKLNDNFVEVYTLLGTGTALTSGISATATVVTLTGPIISNVATFSAGGSAAAPIITRTNDTNTGIFFSDADELAVTTGGSLRTTVSSSGLDVVGNVTATGTVEPAGDTTSGDNAAIGYTSAEGLILTGQGSTNDITVKNDADADVITIATGTTVVGIPGSLDVEGDIDVNGTSNLDVVDIDGAVDMASTLQVDGAITGSSTIQGTTITATIAFVPDASDGAALGTSALEFSDLFLADEAVISFGDDDDVTLTHVADTGLLLSSTDKLMFNDASQFIQGASATVLDIAATDEIELTSTLVDVVGNLAVSGTVVGASTIQGTTITATTAFVPDAQDGAALGTTSLQFSDLFLADGAVIGFGDDNEVTLTHVADTGLLLSSTDQLQFGDSGTYIHQSANGVLDLVSDTELELNATTIDINGDVEVSGTAAIVGVATFTARPVFNGGITIGDGDQIGSASDTDAISIAANGVVTFSQKPVFSAGGSILAADLDIDGATDIGAALTDADLFIVDDGGNGTNRKIAASRFKTYIAGEIGSAADNITAGDAAILFTTSAGNITLDAAGDDTDIILKGTDGGADTTFLTISGADAGEATFNAGIVIADAGNIGSASDKDAIAIASDGVVTFSQIPVMPANSIDSDEYIDGSIDTAHIADSQITVAKMAANSIDSDQYVDGSIDLVHMSANSVDSNQYVDGSIDEVHMSANSIDSDSYVDGSIDRAHLAADIIDGTKIADDVINSEHYAAGSIDREHLAADIIDGTKIADDVINSEHYAAGSIDTEHIANANVTLAKMAINSIDSNQYVDGSIDTAHYAADSITEAKMANDAIGSAELKSLSTLLIKNSSGTTLKTLYGAGA